MINKNPTQCNKIQVSVSKSNKIAGAYHRHFFPVDIESMAQLAELMNKRVWSPIVWDKGLRLKQNFEQSSLIALDFDDGRLTIERCLELLSGSGLAHILGTSKSHQKEKKTQSGIIQKACDRFRLVLFADSACTRKDVYEYNMKEAFEVWPCDTSCKDAARFFYGSPHIISVNDGKKILWNEIPEELNEENIIRRNQERLKQHKDENTLPGWVNATLLYGETPGGRHTVCYRLGATLIHLGWSEQQIIGAIMKSPLKSIGQEDVERAVANGAERSLRESKRY